MQTTALLLSTLLLSFSSQLDRVAPSQTTETEPSTPATALKSGETVEDPAFSVWLEGPAEVVVGKPSTIQARVLAKAPFKCNEKYPAKFKWESQDGFSVESDKVTGISVDGKNGTLPLNFSALRPGALSLSGTLSFSVCTKENCRVEKRKLQLSIQAVPKS